MFDDDGPLLFSLTPRARFFRKHPTPSERLMWRALCGKQLGVRVRRQHVLHPYVVDFFVPAYRLVVEIDGGVHRSDEAQARDARRERVLVAVHRVRVLRIDAELVERDVYAAVARVRAALCY